MNNKFIIIYFYIIATNRRGDISCIVNIDQVMIYMSNNIYLNKIFLTINLIYRKWTRMKTGIWK